MMKDKTVADILKEQANTPKLTPMSLEVFKKLEKRVEELEIGISIPARILGLDSEGGIYFKNSWSTKWGKKDDGA